MARAALPQFATGNDLLEGDSVYFTTQGGWSREIRDAALAVGPEAAADLLVGAAGHGNGLYLLDAEGRARPAHFRETFRMRGPSNRPEHARGAAAAEV